MIKTAEFVISVADGDKLPDYGKPEIAVAGKSNVGKSSLINFLTNRNKLAKTSSEPGRTRLLNFFSVNNGEYYLVDLPGYGFARVSDAEKIKWGALIECYLQTSRNLKNVFVLLDVRHEPSADDKMLMNYLNSYRIDFTVIATKCDKLSRMQCMKRRDQIASSLGIGRDNVILSSSSAKTGREDVERKIESILSAETPSN